MSSGSTVLEAGVILAEGEERSVKAEDLVLIKNRNGNQIMAVCRGGLGSGKRTAEEETKARFELEADNFAVTIQGRKEPAKSTLLKLCNGNIRAPTHVTVNGRFPFPVTTFEERIAAIEQA